jgi:hypothetical protein
LLNINKIQMAKIKMSKNVASIDMTAMCDVAFLLLTFFILTATAKTPEALPVTTPASMEQICTTVVSEGGYAEAGKAFSVSNESFRALSSGSSLPVLAIRLKNNVNGLPNRAFVRIQEGAVFTDQQTIRYTLSKLPSGSALTTGSAWVSVDPFSTVEYNTSATAATGGQTLLTGFVGANSLNINQANPLVQSQAGVKNKQNFIAQNYSSTDSEIYVLIAKNMTANTTNIGGTMLWSEIY